jgi:hypothetical protein
MPEKLSPRAPKFIDERSHPRRLPYGAFAMIMLYWAAKYPSAVAAVPYVGEMTNTVAVSLSIMIAWQSVGQATARLAEWCSHHIEIKVHWTYGRLAGKGGRQPPP